MSEMPERSDIIAQTAAHQSSMDIAEVLKLTDELIFVKTGEHINYLQKAIIEGTLQGRTYLQIAEAAHSSEGHVRDIGYELWKILSEGLGEDITKANFRTILEKPTIYQNNNISSPIVGKTITVKNNVNICPEKTRSPTSPQNPEQTPTQPHIDLGDAPEISSFYDRTPQLTTLKQWILHENTRLVAILGITGIGKTAIAVNLVEQIKHQFDYILWQSLSTSPPLSILQTDLIDFLSQPQEIQSPINPQLIEYLRKYRCLLILDDLQTINSSGQLAGNYQPGYENYATFFKQVAELYHNSCLILISSEKPKEISILEGENQPVRSLQLSGLGADAVEILREKGLADEEKWLELIEPYRGNPLWLKIVATMIQDLFDGSVAEALSYHTLFLGDLEAVLHQSFHRLSESEKQVMSWLASENMPVSLAQIPDSLKLSHGELWKAIQSLGRRYLIEKIREGERSLFTLQPVIKEYVKTQYSEVQ